MMSLPNQYIRCSDVKPHDVILGKTSFCVGHVGTIAWKAIVESRLETYVNATLKSAKKEITQLTLQVLSMVHTSGGRFLKLKMAHTTVGAIAKLKECSSFADGLCEMSDKEARIKVRDAFRYCIKNVRNMRQPSVLLNKMGLSRLLSDTVTYDEIIEYIVKNPGQQQVRKFPRHKLPGNRERNKQRSDFKTGLPAQVFSLDTSIDIWIPSDDTECASPLAFHQQRK